MTTSSQPVGKQPPAKSIMLPTPEKIVSKETVLGLTFVLVISLIILVALLATQYFCCGPPGPWVGIEVTQQEVDGNWSLIVERASPGLALDNVTLTIYNATGSAMTPMYRIPLSVLTEENWTTYRTVYRRADNETEVTVGATILIDADHYPRGSYWMLVDNSGCLSAGTLQ